jgi:hypothetical protein
MILNTHKLFSTVLLLFMYKCAAGLRTNILVVYLKLPLKGYSPLHKLNKQNVTHYLHISVHLRTWIRLFDALNVSPKTWKFPAIKFINQLSPSGALSCNNPYSLETSPPPYHFSIHLNQFRLPWRYQQNKRMIPHVTLYQPVSIAMKTKKLPTWFEY